jgi:hypothetical protein
VSSCTGFAFGGTCNGSTTRTGHTFRQYVEADLRRAAQLIIESERKTVIVLQLARDPRLTAKHAPQVTRAPRERRR